MNELIFFVEVILFLGGTLFAYKFFGKSGLYAWTVFGTILANIQVCISIDLFGFATTSGNVLYASTFLATDILSEKFGKKDAQIAVRLGLAATIFWVLATQVTLRLIPNESDYIHSSLQTVFGMIPRVAVSSIVVYAISQFLDVQLYHFWWKLTGKNEKFLWLRNNGSTMISQLVDTVLFTTFAFLGLYPMHVFFSIMITTYVFKVVVALIDTPFMYLAVRIKPVNTDKL